MPEFEIQSGDRVVIKEVVEEFNKNYKTDFRVTKFEEDHFVMFATIEYEKADLTQVFELGGFFEAKIIKLRREQKIDW